MNIWESKGLLKKYMPALNGHIGRTIPPAAAPIFMVDILNGIRGSIRGKLEVEQRCRQIARYFNSEHCYLVSSGKAALYLILMALKRLHPERQEVIMPAFCCYSVPSAIKRAGLKIRLCDIDPATLDYDFNCLEKLLKEYNSGKSVALHKDGEETERKKGDNNKSGSRRSKELLAVISVDLFGNTANVGRVRKLLNDLNVTLIEDAAQVMGAARDNEKAGTTGDVGFFSLGRGKAISAIEGGVIVTNDAVLGEQIDRETGKISEYSVSDKLKLLFYAFTLWVFQRPSFFWLPKSLPFLKIGDTIYDPTFKICNISCFQAGIVRNWQEKLACFSKLRMCAAQEWSKLRSQMTYVEHFSDTDRQSSFIRYPVRIENHELWERLLRISADQGLGIMTTYPNPVNGIKELQNEFNGQIFPNAYKLSRQLLTLPVHSLLSKNDKNKIVSFLNIMAELNKKSNYKAVEN
jgi:perosamine synthetase